MPKIYSTEDKISICNTIANSSKGILTHFNDDPAKFPHPNTIREWIRSDAIFRANFLQAKEDQADFLVDEMLEIADKCEERRDCIEKAKLRVEVRKFAAQKLKPKVYGDHYKFAQEVKSDYASLDFAKLSKEELEVLRAITKKAGNEHAAYSRRH